MFRRFTFIFLCLFFASALFSQDNKHWVQFRDKGNNPYSLSNPSAYLSPRALARRTTQGIAIDSLDLPVTPAYIAGVAATGATVHSVSKWLNGVIVFTNDTNVLNAIAALPYVVSVNNAGMRVANPDTVNKFSEETYSPLQQQTGRSGYVTSSGLNYGPSYNQISMLGGVCLHNAGYRGQGMQIAIIDAGFYHANVLPVFDTLFMNNRILGTWDFVAGDSSVYEDNQHGMMVLSTMGGNDPGNLVGTAPDASYWLLRSEEAATEYIVEEYYWASAAEYADSVGADVINSSLGYTEFDDPSENHTYADMNGHTTPCARAANIAARKGMALVIAAGNSGQSPWFYISTPGDADSVLTVAALDASGNVAGFSSRGPASDGDVKPCTGAQGVNAVIASPTGGTQTGNGTSFATPITCGLVACLWQAHPSMTNMQLIQYIEMSASQYSNPDSLMGYGIPDFCAANLALSPNPVYDQANDYLYNVVPNPFVNQLDFSFYSMTDQDIQVNLYDVQGRQMIDQLVFAAKKAENHYTLTELEAAGPGVYFLVVKGNEGTYYSRIVKM
ncbi:MAG TPA: S8 family serine peptidase [Bacteroidia bacterium]|nr:S8 family serine peptidase [Bacteroidia bacterium]